MDRIQKIIANSGLCSRRKAEELIERGVVKVNGNVVKLGDKAEMTDNIEVQSRALPKEKKRYLIFNKPRGYVCTLSDPHETRIISKLIQIPERVYPIGRLDKDSEGLLLLTNDGDFANRIMHPRNEIRKTYFVVVDKYLTKDALGKLEKGLVIEERKVQPKIRLISERNLEIVIHEGRKHIIRKMLEELGYKVEVLIRTRIGKLGMGSLNSGKYRDMTEKEKELVFG